MITITSTVTAVMTTLILAIQLQLQTEKDEVLLMPTSHHRSVMLILECIYVTCTHIFW